MCHFQHSKRVGIAQQSTVFKLSCIKILTLTLSQCCIMHALAHACDHATLSVYMYILCHCKVRSELSVIIKFTTCRIHVAAHHNIYYLHAGISSHRL